VSARLRRQIEVEREQVNRLLDIHRPLLAKCAGLAPDPIERSALAAMLHSFYTGIENVLKRIAVECDAGLPQGDTWHRALLDAMTRPGPRRPAAISQATRDALRPYLDFRHVFRHAYSFDLRWEKMSALVTRCEQTWRNVEGELTAFLDRLDRGA
jgi:hypothetical protein